MLIPLYQQTTSRHSEVSGVIDHLAEGVWYHWLVVVESSVIGWHPSHEFVLVAHCKLFYLWHHGILSVVSEN